MKAIKANLLADVSSGTYDQTKTIIRGNVQQKTLGSKNYLGPALPKFIDVYSDTTLSPLMIHATDNGRVFIAVTPVNGTTYDTMPILCYSFNSTTGASAYLGRINVLLPNTPTQTHTSRGFKVYDPGTTGWKICIGSTATTLTYGGLRVVNDIALSDFSIGSPPTIPTATGPGQKAVYHLQDPANIGVNNLTTVPNGIILDEGTGRIYVQNGLAAVPEFYIHDLMATPDVPSTAVSVSAASPAIVTHAAHPYTDNDVVTFTAGTLPTGLALDTVYFVRNALAGSYELSTTSGGAVINTTGSASIGATIARGYGICGTNFIHKTGVLPALTGNVLLTNSQYKAIPIAAPINGGTLNGNACAFIATNTRLVLGLLSELTSGATTWPSRTDSDILGPITEAAFTNTASSWSNLLDSATMVSNATRFITKQVDNLSYVSKFGAIRNEYLEGLSPEAPAGTINTLNIDHANGWLFVVSTTVGQRGIHCMDMQSDAFYDYSYIVSPVISAPDTTLSFIEFIQKKYVGSGLIKAQYRTSGFGSESGGWADVDDTAELSIAIADSIQFKFLFSQQSEDRTVPAQINELYLGVDSNYEISDNWEASRDESDNGSPSRVAFRLKRTYVSVVPQLYFRAYDLSSALIVNHNTVTNAANFEYSTDNGTTWLPLGTVPNTVGTLVRYTFTSPPGVDIRPSLKES